MLGRLLDLSDAHNNALISAVRDVDDTPVRGGIPADLGLWLIRGPVLYVFLEPTLKHPDLPAMVLLGDLHEAEYCSQTCQDARCVSAQDRTHATFLSYLDREFGAYTPDVFLETWTAKEQRLGMADRTDGSFKTKPGPLANFIASAGPCSFRDRVALIDNVAVPCAFQNLRVHVADTRFARGPLRQIDFVLYNAVHHNYTAGQMNFSHQTTVTTFSLLDGLRALLNSDPDVYFSNPVYLAHSRVSHELKQLRPDIRNRLQTAVQQFAPKTQLFDTSTLDRIDRWLSGPPDAVIPEDIAEQLRIFLQHCDTLDLKFYMGVDLYIIARALKTTRDGKRSRLAVCYLGATHIEDIQALLTTAGLYTAKKRVEQGAEGTPTHRCILLNTGAPLSMATDEPDPSLYTGKTLPSDSHKRMVVRTPKHMVAGHRGPTRPRTAASPLIRLSPPATHRPRPRRVVLVPSRDRGRHPGSYAASGHLRLRPSSSVTSVGALGHFQPVVEAPRRKPSRKILSPVRPFASRPRRPSLYQRPQYSSDRTRRVARSPTLRARRTPTPTLRARRTLTPTLRARRAPYSTHRQGRPPRPASSSSRQTLGLRHLAL